MALIPIVIDSREDLDLFALRALADQPMRVLARLRPKWMPAA